MKQILFIDNFRGFSNTFVPVLDVNFLVGENSTGKTSVLGLMKLLSGAGFFLSNRYAFSDAPLNFGNFSDMVSAHSADQNYFRIGAMWEAPQKDDGKKNEGVTGHLLTFVDVDNVPRPSRYTFCAGAEKISLAYEGDDVYYQTQRIDAPLTIDEMCHVFPEWIREQSIDISSQYQKLEVPRDFPAGIPPLLLTLSVVWEMRETKKDNSEHKETLREFEFPVDDAGIFKPEVTWIAPIRTKPKRTYDEVRLDFSPEGEHTPYAIRRMLKSKSAAAFKKEMKRAGRDSGLFQDVRVKDYGRTRFELDIVLDGKPLNISNVGYGVSQSLPVLAEVIARGHGAWLAIQQPEVHLHPRAQAALGDIFFEVAATERKLLLVETHSDFMIDRFRMNYQSQRSDKPKSQILFFERRDKHNVITPLPISETGELPKDQPDNYREFFIREELRLLQL